MTPLDGFFGARSIVLVGASRSPGRLGHTLAKNLVESGYSGDVHFVNPKGGELFGRPLLPSLADLDGPADLAVLLVPAQLAPGTVAACGRAGIRNVILSSGGFGELGSDGADLERSLASEASRHGVRLLGPNCIGIIDAHRHLDTTFLASDLPPAGPLGVISQSGALCAAIIDQAGPMAPGFSRLVSLGNQLDLDAADALDSLGSDPNTRAILLYLESVRDGDGLLRAAAAAASRKPVFALKVGRSAAARAAAQSHTGALAADDRVIEAAFRRAGIIRVDSIRELVEAGRVAALRKATLPRRLAILTNAGGPGVAATDRAEQLGLEIAALSGRTTEALGALLPTAAGLGNPVDTLPAAGPREFGESLRILLEDDAVDAALVILPRPPGHDPAEIATALARVATASPKLVVVVLMGRAELEPARLVLSGAGLPVFDYPEDAARAMAHTVARPAAPVAPAHANPASPKFLEMVPDGAGPGWLSYGDSMALLAGAGLPVEQPVFATADLDLALLLSAPSYPVAVKAQAASALHKSDVGGVRLNLATPDDAASAFEEMLGRIPDLEGIWLESMAPAGVDLLVGAVRDPDFGPIVMVGGGGTGVEEDADVAIDLAPLSPALARELLLRTRAGRSLAAGRGRLESDLAAAVDAVVAIGDLIAGCPRIAEVEINPFRVLRDGARALDARARVTGA